MRRFIGIFGLCIAVLNLCLLGYDTILTIRRATTATPETVFYEIAKGQAEERMTKRVNGVKAEASDVEGFPQLRTQPETRWIGTFLHLGLIWIALLACLLLLVEPKQWEVVKKP